MLEAMVYYYGYTCIFLWISCTNRDRRWCFCFKKKIGFKDSSVVCKFRVSEAVVAHPPQMYVSNSALSVS
jgi:hypothetical protein